MTEDKKAKLARQIDRGARAEQTLQDLDEAFKALKQDCYDTFASSDLHDDEGRKTCRIYLRVLEDVELRFKTATRTGKAAQKELIRLNSNVRTING